MGTFRKTAREAVIFILLGPVVAAIAAFAFLQRQNIERAKTEAAQAVYASDVKSLPPGLRQDNSVLVPFERMRILRNLTSGWIRYYDRDGLFQSGWYRVNP